MNSMNISYSIFYIACWIISGVSLFVVGILMILTHGLIFISIVVISFLYIFTGIKVYKNPIAYRLKGNNIYIYSPVKASTFLKLDEIEKVDCYFNICILKSTNSRLFLNLNRISKNDRYIILDFLRSGYQF